MPRDCTKRSISWATVSHASWNCHKPLSQRSIFASAYSFLCLLLGELPSQSQIAHSSALFWERRSWSLRSSSRSSVSQFDWSQVQLCPRASLEYGDFLHESYWKSEDYYDATSVDAIRWLGSGEVLYGASARVVGFFASRGSLGRDDLPQDNCRMIRHDRARDSGCWTWWA